MEASNIHYLKIKDIKSEIIKELTINSKKGDNGCLAVIGGSLEYTGAPYYSAISGLKGGSDLSHVFCHTEAAIPIKSYSPELIVHPGFNLFSNEELINKTIRWFKSMNSILIGPGLGRDLDTEKIFISFSKSISLLENIPLIYDADGVWFWAKLNNENKDTSQNENIKIINSNKNLIMTPNFTEFEKMCKILGEEFNPNCIEDQKSFIDLLCNEENTNDIISIENPQNSEKYHNIFLNEINLCNKFSNNFILVKKGKVDIITDGFKFYIVKNKGSLKRTGGIGDILSGLINCYCGMLSQRIKNNSSKSQNNLLSHSDLFKCCIFGCYICREASKIAYEKMKYALTAPDIIKEIPSVVNMLY